MHGTDTGCQVRGQLAILPQTADTMAPTVQRPEALSEDNRATHYHTKHPRRIPSALKVREAAWTSGASQEFQRRDSQAVTFDNEDPTMTRQHIFLAGSQEH